MYRYFFNGLGNDGSSAVLPLLQLLPVSGQFPVRIQGFEIFKIFQQDRIPAQVFHHLTDHIHHLFLDGIKYPLVFMAGINDSAVFQVGEVPGCFSLGKVQDLLEVGNA